MTMSAASRTKALVSDLRGTLRVALLWVLLRTLHEARWRVLLGLLGGKAGLYIIHDGHQRTVRPDHKDLAIACNKRAVLHSPQLRLLLMRHILLRLLGVLLSLGVLLLRVLLRVHLLPLAVHAVLGHGLWVTFMRVRVARHM